MSLQAVIDHISTLFIIQNSENNSWELSVAVLQQSSANLIILNLISSLINKYYLDFEMSANNKFNKLKT